MKDPSELTKEELARVVERIRDALYLESIGGNKQGRYSRDKVWDAETIEEVDAALAEADLSPQDSG